MSGQFRTQLCTVFTWEASPSFIQRSKQTGSAAQMGWMALWWAFAVPRDSMIVCKNQERPIAAVLTSSLQRSPMFLFKNVIWHARGFPDYPEKESKLS